MRKTKIICTLGPATQTVDVIKNLIQDGMDAARLNFSHGTHESQLELINKLKQAREELNAPIPLLLDTKGPEVRTMMMEQGTAVLQKGTLFTLTTNDVKGNEKIVSITFKGLPEDLKTGDRVLIDDGLIELEVKNITDTDIECLVLNGGELGSQKGVNVPNVYLNLPAVTEKDVADIQFGIENGFDYIAASFIRRASDVIQIRKVLENNNGLHIQIIAKIENRDGVNNIDEILEVADGIMVARGDLGVEIPPEEVPLVQKKLIRKANLRGKLVITATQMLESMITNPRPTRAEANDVANAIIDGSDAIMLSGETAKGSHPLESVQMMDRIAKKIEGSIDYNHKLAKSFPALETSVTNAVCSAACWAAAELTTSCIATITNSGFTARMVARFRPSCNISACAMNEVVWRQLNLVWGVRPSITHNITEDIDIYELATAKAVESSLAADGDTVVVVAGVPVGISGATNSMKVNIVGNVLAKGVGFGNTTLIAQAAVIKNMDEIDKYFKQGDVLVVSHTSNEMIPYMKKAAAVVVGPIDSVENCHAQIVCSTLDKPVIICNSRVVEAIPNRMIITVDAMKGFVYNGEPK